MDRAISFSCLVLVAYLVLFQPKSQQVTPSLVAAPKVDVNFDLSYELMKSVLDSPAFEEKLNVMIGSMVPVVETHSVGATNSSSQRFERSSSSSVNELLVKQLNSDVRLLKVESAIETFKSDLLGLADKSITENVSDKIRQNYLSAMDRFPGGAMISYFGIPEFVPTGWTYCKAKSISDLYGSYRSSEDSKSFIHLCKLNFKVKTEIELRLMRTYTLSNSDLKEKAKLGIERTQSIDTLVESDLKQLRGVWKRLLNEAYDMFMDDIQRNDKSAITQSESDYDIIHRYFYSIKRLHQ